MRAGADDVSDLATYIDTGREVVSVGARERCSEVEVISAARCFHCQRIELRQEILDVMVRTKLLEFLNAIFMRLHVKVEDDIIIPEMNAVVVVFVIVEPLVDMCLVCALAYVPGLARQRTFRAGVDDEYIDPPSGHR